MPIVLSHLLGFSLGASLSWLAAPTLDRSEGPVTSTPAFRIVAAFAAFVWLPAVGYFALFHGDWAYLYLLERHPSALDLSLVLLSGACVVGGFVVAARPARKRQVGALFAAVGTPTAVALTAAALAFRRLAVSATFAQFHGDFGTEPLGSSVLGKGLLLVGAVLSIAIGWVAWSLRVPGEP